MYRTCLPVKTEPDDDGSIFVCFVCEKEFSRVQELNKHMTEHAEPLDEPENIEIVETEVKFRLTQQKPKASNNFFLSPEKVLLQPKKCQNSKPKKKLINKKSSAEQAAERARKVQMYIQAQEKRSNKKVNLENDCDTDNESPFTEESNYTSISGGTVISYEPEGFVCPKQTRFPNKIPMQNEPDNELSFFSEGSVSKYQSSRLKGDSSDKFKQGRPANRNSKLFQGDDFAEGFFMGNPLKGRPTSGTLAKEKGSHPCPECGKTFGSLPALKMHVRSHFEAKEISCPMCQAVFPQRYILFEHIANDHEEALDDLICSICNKMFTRSDSLKTHMVRMHDRSGGLNCMVCNKSFPSQAQLEIHIRVHTGERPFKCSECGRGFVQKVHLKTHLRTMHNIAESLATPCRLCGMVLKGRNVLREHYVVKHDMSTAQYRHEVMRLRREGKLPERVPPTVKVVSPNFTYKSVSATHLTDTVDSSISYQRSGEFGQSKKSKRLGGVLAKVMNANDDVMFSPNDDILVKEEDELPYIDCNYKQSGSAMKQAKRIRLMGGHMAKIMNVNDDVMFSPNDSNMSSRNEDELKFVESAFKVAEEMDLLGEGNSALIVPSDAASSSGMYYTLPDMMHSTGVEKDHDEFELSGEMCNFSSTEVDQRSRMVMAAPLEDVDAESTGQVEMLSM